MNGSAASTASPGPAAGVAAPVRLAAETDASCRVPLLILFGGGALWLVLASVLALIASIKFHSPAFLADVSWLTYGRVRPAFLNGALYGFCVPAGLGFGLWLLSRLGQTRLAQPLLIAVGALGWNLGVAVGVGGILAGDASGYENFDLPGYAVGILFVAYLLMGAWGVVTFRRRTVPVVFVSQWFVLAALFWFPWIFSTAGLLLQVFPARGMAQSVIVWWFSQNFLTVWLGLLGLATLFYLVSKIAGRDLDNHNLALFAFWTLLLFGSWACVPVTAPVPAWMPVLSRVAAVLSAFSLVAVGLVLARTLRGGREHLVAGGRADSDAVVLRFALAGAAGFLIAGLLRVAGFLPAPGVPLQLSWFHPATTHLQWFGFFALTTFGGIYYVAPRLAGVSFPKPALIRVHFWLSATGIVLLAFPLLAAGVMESLRMSDPNVAFNNITRSNLHFLRVSTIGDLLLLAGNLIFLLNIVQLVLGAGRGTAASFLKAIMAPPEAAPSAPAAQAGPVRTKGGKP